MSVWVLTFEVNDYDQHGEYFHYAWDHFPSDVELKIHLTKDMWKHLEHIKQGGGRINIEDTWYFLKEIE